MKHKGEKNNLKLESLELFSYFQELMQKENVEKCV